MENDPTTVGLKEGTYGSIKLYIVGFILSIILTLAVYFLVSEHVLSGKWLNYTIATLSSIQVLIQLTFFLHLGNESKPYWNSVSFLFTLAVVLTVVFGSLWIMEHLDYNMMSMPEQQMQQKMDASI